MIPQQGTPEWLFWRRAHIGSSDAAVIMGASPWKTPHRLWMEKQGLVEDFPVNAAMSKGIAHEEEARQAFEREIGQSFFPAVVTNPKLPWMIASLDGMTFDGDTIVEIKVPGKRTLEAAAEGVIEYHYLWQVQHQLAVTGLKSAYFWVWNHDERTGYKIIVLRDDRMIEDLVAEETKFFEHMQTSTPPPSKLDDYVVVETDEWATAAEAWMRANAIVKLADQERKIAEEQEKIARTRLVDLTPGPQARGCGVRLTKVVRQGAVDMDKICRQFSIKASDLDEFRKDKSEYYKIVEE